MHQDQKKSLNQWSVWMPLLLAVVLVGGMLIGMELQSVAPAVVMEKEGENEGNAYGQGKIEELLRYIEAKYVDEVDRDKLVDEAIASILAQLDPHSNYINAERVKEINERLQGNYDGIGIEYIILEDTVVVFKPLADGPSDKAGVQVGDRIISVGDSLVAGVQINHTRIRNLLRGASGEGIDLGILRKNNKEIIHLRVTRDKIPLQSIETSLMLDKETGFIKIADFSSNTYEEFMKGLEDLSEKYGMKNLVIDLRQNPGGYLQEATSILSQLFQEKDKLLVYTEGRATYRNNYESNGRSFFPVKDIVVLIDEMSASASEILAGAIQDQDRGIIIGRRSFGKGLVQEQYNLRDGSALRLTVARYYTPSGRSIQKPYSDETEYDNDFWNRVHSGELSSAEQIALADSTQFFTSGGRVVYGGGGIIPDIFVPLDTTLLEEASLHLQMYVKQFAFRFLESQPERFREYTSEQFLGSFHIDEATWEQYLRYLQRRGENPEFQYTPAVIEETKRYLKARMAKQLFGEEAYYQVLTRDDPMVTEALKVLSRSNPLSVIRQ